MKTITSITGNIIDIFSKRIFPGTVFIKNGKIEKIEPSNMKQEGYILPGFIDAHIHIESSMLVPYEFAKIALKHGTIGTISDPHEIANVLGIYGVEYMLDNAKNAKLKFHFGAPSCVPATSFETAGDVLDSIAIENLMARDNIYYLSEMMNYPGVLFKDEEVLKKIEIAKKYKKPIDGHAPGLRGKDAKNYIAAGITTDHECFTLEEAQEKLSYGMKILIREGSAARNFNALHPLINTHSDEIMFCCDDKHPDELLLFHIDEHVRKSIEIGYDLFDVLKIACVNPVLHYKMNVGLLRENDAADFIKVNNLKDFKVELTVIDGEIVAEHNQTFLPTKTHTTPNKFSTSKKNENDFKIKSEGATIRIIEALDGQLITNEIHHEANNINGFLESDIENDILKIAVINRYNDVPPTIAFVKNFGLKRGAIASSVAHDSHNIIVVGCDDKSITRAVNLLIEHTGGLSLIDDEKEITIALPVAGLMSDKDCETIGNAYSKIDKEAKQLGSKLKAPYMLLSFMGLLVIPKLKLSDKGLFDGNSFQFTSVNF